MVKFKVTRRVASGCSHVDWLAASKTIRAKFFLGAALFFMFVSTSLAAQASPTSEYELKATFLFNFIKFTEWPPEELGKNDDPFVIGVLGKDPFGAALDKVVEGETIHNKKLVVRRFPHMNQSAVGCHILFIGALEERHLVAILKLVEGQAVLTVSEIINFAERGGVIELKKENNRILFEINLLAAKRSRLGLNAQLLKLAKVVRGTP